MALSVAILKAESNWYQSYGRWAPDPTKRPRLRLALVQMNSKEKARDQNVEKACRYIDKAVSDGTQIIVLPEFFNIEYFFFGRDYSYVSYAEPDDGPTMTKIRDKSREHRVWIIATIYEEEAPGVYFDTAMVVTPEGEIAGKYRKVHPSAVGSLEKIYFKRGSRFPIFDVLGWRIGISICYDNSFPETARILAVKGAELIVMPFATPHYDMWEKMLMARAFDNLSYVAVCNKVGNECGYTFAGSSLIISPYGEVIRKGSTEDDEIIAETLDLKNVYEARRRYPMFRDRRPETYRELAQFEEDARSL
jgi:N-carbamoylputrescine amidase